jgi:chaperonin GroEL (HSP60 family)
MVKDGIIDSFTVVKNSLINGVEVGCLLLTCKTAII